LNPSIKLANAFSFGARDVAAGGLRRSRGTQVDGCA
jgi:hypothetical protein